MNFAINPWVAIGVLASTAATDAAYVFFNAAVSSRRRVWAANWSSIWYMLSAFAVISYTENALYVAFAALGSRLGNPRVTRAPGNAYSPTHRSPAQSRRPNAVLAKPGSATSPRNSR